MFRRHIDILLIVLFIIGGAASLIYGSGVDATFNTVTVTTLTPGQCVQATTGGLLTSVACGSGGGGGGTPGGPNFALQYNGSGSFAGAGPFTGLLLGNGSAPISAYGGTASPGAQVMTGLTATGTAISIPLSCSSLSNAANSCSTDTTNATNIFSGTLAALRLPSTTVLNVTNDANIVGSIVSQVLTLGWAGILPLARGGNGTATPTLTAGPGISVTGAWGSNTVGLATSASTVINGTVGTATCAQFQGGIFKINDCLLQGYQQISTAQTYSFPVACAVANVNVLQGCTPLFGSSNGSGITLPNSNSMTPETCEIQVTCQ